MAAREGGRRRPKRDLGAVGAHAMPHADAENSQVVGALRETERPAQRLGGTFYLLVGHRARGACHHIRAALVVETQLEGTRLVEGSAELDLVAVAPLALASQTRAHEGGGALVAELRRARKRRNDVVGLRDELSLVGKMLPRCHAASGRLRPGGGHAVGRRALHLHDASTCEGGLLLGDLDGKHVAGSGAFDEHGLPAFEVRDRLGAEPHTLDCHDFFHAPCLFSLIPVMSVCDSPMIAYNF